MQPVHPSSLRTLVALVALSLLALPGRAQDPPGGKASRPNIILIYADDHAERAISAYGSDLASLAPTPNIDRIAAGGVRFVRSFVGNSLCAPARATVLTGKLSHLNGVRDNRAVFDSSQTTFPKLLQAAGYQTALIGKWHLKSDPTGFDHWEVLQGQGTYYEPELRTPDGPVVHHGYVTGILTERALDWLRDGRDPSRPFLLMLQHKAPHREWSPGPDDLHWLDDATLPEPPTLFDDGTGRGTAFQQQEMTIAHHLNPLDLKMRHPPRMNDEEAVPWDAAYGPKNAAHDALGLEGDAETQWRYERFLKDYLRCIHAVDRSVGAVLDWLDQNGLAGNTVVVYSSDQGFYLGEHGWFDKRWMYEESMRTPLLVRWPGVTAPGRVESHLVQNIDLAPTFLEIAGVPVPDDVQGQSLVPLLRGEDPSSWRHSLYYHYFEFPAVHAVNEHYGVRTERYKLIRFGALDEWEMYDLARDPWELRSVYDDPSYTAVRTQLTAELSRLRALYGDKEGE